MIQYRNYELVDQIGPHRRTVVASYGFEFIIRPMLAGCGLNVERLVAGPLVDMAQWRSRGKAQAVRDAVDARSLSEAIAITDSPRDQDVLDAVAHPILRMWADVRPIRAQADVYIPLVYLSRVKRQGRREILRQVLLDDYMLVLLVFAGVNPWSTNLLLGLTCAFFSFFCVYEIGYRENDRLGEEFEENPRLTEAYTNGETGREPRWFPWIYGIALGVLANLFLHSGAADWTAVLFATALWLVFLLATRIIFAVYNRLDEVTRVYLFPWLQVAKTFGFLLLLPTTLAGGAAMLAQVIRRWQNYANYRAGGDEHRHPNLTTRVACYVLLIATLAMMTDQQLIWHWHTWLLLGWFVVRGAMQIAQSIQNVRWKGQPIFGR